MLQSYASNFSAKTRLSQILSSHACGSGFAEDGGGGLQDGSHHLSGGVAMLRLGDPDYPELLASIPDPPERIYVRGALSKTGGVALVGSRRPTRYGLRMAEALSQSAARAGCVTVSGLARGIDTEVHRSTLKAGGVTWAVLGSGLDRVYPPENEALADEIVAKGGAVISEVPLSSPPFPFNFPRRNRIIAGLSWGTVVIEGDAKSGSLITARCAAEQGREVFAVPGSADSPMSEGPLKLIKDGACLVRDWEDVAEAMPPGIDFARLPSVGGEPPPGPAEPLEENERRVMDHLSSQDLLWEDLLARTALGTELLSVTLLQLEIKGLIRSCPGQKYAKN